METPQGSSAAQTKNKNEEMKIRITIKIMKLQQGSSAVYCFHNSPTHVTSCSAPAGNNDN